MYFQPTQCTLWGVKWVPLNVRVGQQRATWWKEYSQEVGVVILELSFLSELRVVVAVIGFFFGW